MFGKIKITPNPFRAHSEGLLVKWSPHGPFVVPVNINTFVNYLRDSQSVYFTMPVVHVLTYCLLCRTKNSMYNVCYFLVKFVIHRLLNRQSLKVVLSKLNTCEFNNLNNNFYPHNLQYSNPKKWPKAKSAAYLYSVQYLLY